MNEYYYERMQNNKYARAIARKRAALIRRRFIMLIMFVFITSIAIISINHFIYANDKTDNLSKKYRSEMIYCGDSIDSLSSDYQEYGYSSENRFRNELCSINGITSDTTLIAGNYLIIPYYEGI